MDSPTGNQRKEARQAKEMQIFQESITSINANYKIWTAMANQYEQKILAHTTVLDTFRGIFSNKMDFCIISTILVKWENNVNTLGIIIKSD